MRAFMHHVLELLIHPTLLIECLFFYFTGFTLNIVSLAGITLATGMLVDGAIILVDQYMARKSSEIDRDWRGTAFIAWACGSAVAVVVEFYFPHLSTAISAMLAGGIAYAVLSMIPSAERAAA